MARTINLGLLKLLDNQKYRRDATLQELINKLDNLIVEGDGAFIEYFDEDSQAVISAPLGPSMLHRARPVLDDFFFVNQDDADVADNGRGIVIRKDANSEVICVLTRARGGGGASAEVGVNRASGADTCVGPIIGVEDGTHYTLHVTDDGDAVIGKWTDYETLDAEVVAHAQLDPMSTVSCALAIVASGSNIIGKLMLDGDFEIEIARMTGETGAEAAIDRVGMFVRKDAGAQAIAGFWHFLQ